jgi:hypothetical protein
MMRLGTRISAIGRCLRRQRRQLAVLLVLLCCVLAESILCIVHCQIAIPWLLGQPHVHEHAHLTGTHAAVEAPNSASLRPALGTALPTQPSAFCFHTIGDPFSGLTAPPSPIHDHLPVSEVALLGVVLLFHVCLRAPPLRLLLTDPPPTPPPLSILR